MSKRCAGAEVIKATHEVAFPFTSLWPQEASPERLQELVRSHWSIENGQHHRRDRTQDEDRCTVGQTNTARSLSLFRSLAIFLCEASGPRKGTKLSLPDFQRGALPPALGLDPALHAQDRRRLKGGAQSKLDTALVGRVPALFAAEVPTASNHLSPPIPFSQSVRHCPTSPSRENRANALDHVAPNFVTRRDAQAGQFGGVAKPDDGAATGAHAGVGGDGTVLERPEFGLFGDKIIQSRAAHRALNPGRHGGKPGKRPALCPQSLALWKPSMTESKSSCQKRVESPTLR